MLMSQREVLAVSNPRTSEKCKQQEGRELERMVQGGTIICNGLELLEERCRQAAGEWL